MRRALTTLALCVLAAGCSADETTELVVVVHSNISVPEEMDSIRVRAVRYDADGTATEDEQASGALSSAGDLPLWVVLAHRGGPLGPVEVTAEGLLGDTVVVAQRARTSFVRGKRLVLNMQLLRSCAGMDCGEEMTCTASGCASIDVPPESLPEWPGAIERVDGSVPAGGCTSAAGCPDPPANAVATCDSGECGWECREGFEDCNADESDGCEVNLRSPESCGACGNTCPDPPGATPTCTDGACGFVCADERADCNGTASDGCETDLSSPSTCGGCDNACSDPTPRCGMNPDTGARVCVSGCPDTLPVDCAGSCVDTDVDRDHCGTCFLECAERPNSTPICTDGTCGLECMAGWGDCDGLADNGCETPLTSLTHCGACDTACSLSRASSTCASGSCEISSCSMGFDDCDSDPANGCETSLNTTSDCTSCGMTCTRPNGMVSCATGSCTLVGCDAGYADCNSMEIDGCEQSLTTLSNCGGCGTTCSLANATETCASGSCEVDTCDSGWGDCDGAASNGCETALTTMTDCGSCGTTCSLPNATETCASGSCAVASCDAGFADCDSDPTNGCETPLDTTSDCGSCGTGCSLPNAVTSCAGGSCMLVECMPGWANCDGDSTDGCETPLTTLSDCGGCGVTCALDNGSETCATGTCQVDTCDAGWDDCDGDPSNGCETPLATVTDCGACGTTCTLPHAVETCAAGSCDIASCESGWDDCNATVSDGCEASLASTSTCTDCGTTCSGGTPVCDPASGCVTGCAAGEVLCSGSCTDTDTDPSHCGGCGLACSTNHATPSCSGGSCVLACDSGWGDCNGDVTDGCETPLNTLTDCGSCGTSCSLANGTESCSTGTCTLTGCDSGWGNCDSTGSNGCETPLNTLTDCGSCGTSCSLANGTESCSTGTCTLGTCDSGWGNCDGVGGNGCEQSLTTLSNCGGCGTTCDLAHASESCSTGTCTLGTCDSGWGNCDGDPSNGCETPLTTLTDCGSCGTGCDLANGTESCATGTCTLTGCDMGWDDCDSTDSNGCETSLTTLSDCGSCGTGCDLANGTESCASGVCTLTGCDGGWGDCDSTDSNGCETSLTTLGDCGSCGTTCDLDHAMESCSTGSCELTDCESDWGNCDSDETNGCETSLTTLSDCGDCDAACDLTNASESCSTGTCSLVSCDMGWGDCDGDSTNGCETDTTTSDAHCGMCGNACGFPLSCTGGACACAPGCDCDQNMCRTGSPCSCDGGCSCSLRCADNCSADCTGVGTTCNVVARVNQTHRFRCETGATCTVDARGTGNFGNVSDRAICEDSGTSCEIDCRDMGPSSTSNCQLDCLNGAACLVRCEPGNSSCFIDDCTDDGGSDATITDCGGGVYACNRSCP